VYNSFRGAWDHYHSNYYVIAAIKCATEFTSAENITTTIIIDLGCGLHKLERYPPV